MISIFDVARYILISAGSIPTFKLQKLCYYSQAWYLVWNDLPLFYEDFEVWDTCPVCPELYQAHKNFNTISADDLGMGNENKLTPEQKKDIDKVVAFYKEMPGHLLSNLICQEQPFKETKESPRGDCNIIPKKLMHDYYASL